MVDNERLIHALEAGIHLEEKRASSCTSELACSPLATVKVRRLFGGWGVEFSVGVQHFAIGPQDYETEREAEWMATMFRNALEKANAGIDAQKGEK